MAILDYYLQDTDTTAVAARLRQANIPFIVCSGSFAANELDAVFAGARVLAKPFSTEGLIDAVVGATPWTKRRQLDARTHQRHSPSCAKSGRGGEISRRRRHPALSWQLRGLEQAGRAGWRFSRFACSHGRREGKVSRRAHRAARRSPTVPRSISQSSCRSAPPWSDRRCGGSLR